MRVQFVSGCVAAHRYVYRRAPRRTALARIGAVIRGVHLRDYKGSGPIGRGEHDVRTAGAVKIQGPVWIRHPSRRPIPESTRERRGIHMHRSGVEVCTAVYDRTRCHTPLMHVGIVERASIGDEPLASELGNGRISRCVIRSAGRVGIAHADPVPGTRPGYGLKVFHQARI